MWVFVSAMFAATAEDCIRTGIVIDLFPRSALERISNPVSTLVVLNLETVHFAIISFLLALASGVGIWCYHWFWVLVLYQAANTIILFAKYKGYCNPFA